MICRKISQIGVQPVSRFFPCQTGCMLRLLRLLFVLFNRSFCSRRDLLLENLALRQQLAVLKQRRPRPRFSASDRLFWATLCRLWSRWQQALILVQPETVVRWHRSGFKMYWNWLSRHRTHSARRCVSRELRDLIFRMAPDNRIWRRRAFMASLLMPGFDLSREPYGHARLLKLAAASQRAQFTDRLPSIC